MNANVYILKQTILIYALVFGFATALTFMFRKADWGRNMRTAILSWLAIFALFLSAGFAGGKPFALLIGIIALLGVLEYYRLSNIRGLWIYGTAVVLVAAGVATSLLRQTTLFYAIPGIATMAFMVCQVATSSYEDINRRSGIATAGFIYWGWLPLHFVFIRQFEQGFGYIVLLCTMIAFNDNSAYYVGKLLGRNSRKFSPEISPNKTWAGTIGGFIATVLIAQAFRFTIPHFTARDMLLMSLVIALSIPVGDLIESAIKRDLKVKDSGNLIPGHGGVMDRFDSWIFTAPIMYCFSHFLIVKGI
jgi:phosphatidate cytidylyltransferase